MVSPFSKVKNNTAIINFFCIKILERYEESLSCKYNVNGLNR